MKNKSQSHRSQNTFRFKSFNEKIKSIQVSSRNYILKKIESDSDVETLLWQTVQHWKDLNLTLGFQNFVSALGSECQTVPQLLLNEEHVADTFKAHVNADDVLALGPVLQALVGFARDIPDLFYRKHFYPFVTQLVAIATSNTRCHETVEHIFVAFVSLFTLLQKYIKDDCARLFIQSDFCSLLAGRHPWYINELAAQALGNLVRKFPNKREVIALCLRRLKKDPSEKEGLGRLMFHTIKSDVARRLHSSAASTLSLLVDLVTEDGAPSEESVAMVVFCLRQLAGHVVANVEVPVSWQETWKHESKRVWPILLDRLDPPPEESRRNDEASVSAVLEFVYELVQFKNAALVTDFDRVLTVLGTAAEWVRSDTSRSTMANIVGKLVNSSCYDGSSDALRLFLSSYLGGSEVLPSSVFYFAEVVLCVPLFEEEVLPFLLKFVSSVLKKDDDEELKEEMLSSLTAIVAAKTSLVRGAPDLTAWSVYPLDFGEEGEPEDAPSKLLEHFLGGGLDPGGSNIETLIQACICLPHLSPLQAEDFVPYLYSILDSAIETLEGEAPPSPFVCKGLEPPRKKRKSEGGDGIESSPPPRVDLNTSVSPGINDKSRKLAFLIGVAMETLHHILSGTDFLAVFEDRRRLLLSTLKVCPHLRDDVHILKALDVFLSVLAEEGDSDVLNEKTFREVYPMLATGLASHKALVRWLVSHIFSLFPLPRAPLASGESEENLFVIMFQVESNPISPLEYKERLRLLHRLSVEFVRLNQPETRFYDTAPLLFLVGQLYINFKEFWKPVVKAISQYAHALPEEVFWPLWVSTLKLASNSVMLALCGKTPPGEESTSFADVALGQLHSDLVSHPGHASLNAKPNFLNFRDLLWQAMQAFPDLCEKRNKDVVTLFFNFLTNELFPADFNVAPTQDIAARSPDEEESSSGLSEDEEDEKPIDAKHRVRKAPTKSLCEHLSLFAKFHNPKVIYKSKDLEEIYREFLSHPYLKAQKLALDCVMTYKHKYVAPYKETLYNILDDKCFKNELVLFDIEGKGEEGDGRSLKEDHRKDFMPILMRILYGKMLYKTGGHTSGKGHAALRKGVVIRFLAGANETELDTFLNLSFDIMLTHLEGDALEVVERAKRNTDPKRVVPLKRLQGALGTLQEIFDKLGSLLVTKRSFLLKVILFILGMCGTLLENRDQLCSHFLPSLKNLRQAGMQKLITFFASYHDYHWSRRELKAVYEAAVWPILDKLVDEGIYTPTPLLRLFGCWAENSSYHPLLARHHPDDDTLTPMPFLMKLISHRKCSSGVVGAVYDLIGHLLNEAPKKEDDVEQQDPFDLPLDDALPLEEKAAELGLPNLTCGESLVFSCMDLLLGNLKENLSSLRKDQLIKKKFLSILIHLAQWVRDRADAKELVDAIVPLLRKNCVKQNEKVCYLLEVCQNLLPTIRSPGKYSLDFVCLFSVLNGRSARTALCQVIQSLYPAGEKGNKLAKWCAELNAWKEEMAEEIDSETRLRCSREVNAYLKATDVLEEDVVSFLMHQNVWVLRQGGDQALSDLAVLGLQNLISMLVRLQATHSLKVKRLLDAHLLPLLKAGLKDKKETARDNVVKVLTCAVHQCYEFNPRLKDLFALADLHDPEVDFFINITHLQRGRRTRAMTRLAQNLQEGKVRLQTETMSDFILPLVSVYLFKDEYATDPNLLTGSVVCVGALAKHLPWYHYQNLLRHYLNLVSRELHQLKLGVRVLEAVIDAFHEDVSHLGTSSQLTPKMEEDGEATSRVDTEGDLGEEEFQSLEEYPELLCDDAEAKAQKVFRALTQDIIPQIQRTLSKRSARDTEHKINKKKYPEEEDIKRIPLALALVKLLKKLPKELLEQNVNSVLSKLIEFLKSRAESIRKEARDMLVKVMVELGGDYLPCLVSDMNAILTRGYQSHVMVFTLHSVLTGLQDTLAVPHIAPCLSEIVTICLEDLFGDKAAEKGVTQLSTKVKEVKAEKGYPILGIVGGLIAVDHLETVMVPLKQKLQTHDKKVINKVVICLQKVRDGLERNSNITIEHKSLFIYGVLNEKIKELSLEEGSKDKNHHKGHATTRPDSFLVEPEPRRVGLMPKTSLKTTSHVLIEFSLSLLHHLLRFKHFSPEDAHHCGLLDPYVPIMSNCLVSEYPDVSIEALRVIGLLLKFNLPSLKENLPKMVGQMFVILNKFSSAELTKGKLFQLVQLDFKTIATLMKEVSSYKLDPEHCKVLLYYARNNLEDPNQHHSSFIILHAIIRQKVHSEELHNLMLALQEMSITSTNLNMLDQARRTYFDYLLNYPKKKKAQFTKVLFFYLKNVSYDVPQGRMSAAIMLADLISKYSKMMDQKMEVAIWFKLTEQLLKEETKEQRTMLHKLLRSLFLKSERKNVLIDNCLKLFEDDLMKSRAENSLAVNMAAQSLLAMLDLQVTDLPRVVLEALVPRVVELLHPARFQPSSDLADEKAAHKETSIFDLTLTSLLELFMKLMDLYCTPGSNLSKWNSHVKYDAWTSVKDHLLYPNLKVRLTSAAIIGQLFALYSTEEMVRPPLASSKEKVESLVVDLCEQLYTECPIESPLLQELGLAVVRNLIYLIRQANQIPIKLGKANRPRSERLEDGKTTGTSSSEIPQDGLNPPAHADSSFLLGEMTSSSSQDPIVNGAYAVLHKVGVIAYDELRKRGRHSTFRRECLLNLIAGTVVVLGERFEHSDSVVSFVLNHLTRELSDRSLPEALAGRTKEVANLVREKVGVERYSEETVRIQASLEKRRIERKARVRELAVSNPELASQKKAKKQVAKKESRKRKIAELKLKPSKKRRLKDLAFVRG